MRIALISFVARGAADQYIAETANALVDSHQVFVLIPAFTSETYFDKRVLLHKLNLSVNLFLSIFQTLNPFFVGILLRKLKTIQPDVVQITFEHRFSFLFAYLLKKRYPLIITMHEPDYISNRGKCGNFIAGILQNLNNRALALNADKILVHSLKLMGSKLFRNIPDKKLAVVPLGQFSYFKSLLLSDKESSANILFFGKIAPYKGLAYLIEAARIVKTELPGVTFTIAGEGSLDKYKELFENADYFIIHNRFVSDLEVARLFEASSLVVLPYTEGSQTGIISIAATFKKPVIATNVGNFSEMVLDGETGLIVPPKDTYTLARAIITLLKDDNLRRQMGEKAYLIMNERFSRKTIADKLNEIYQDLIKTGLH